MISKKGQNISLNKLITLILVVLAIVITVFGLFYFNIPDKLNNLFPDFTRTNNIDSNKGVVVGCENEIASIGTNTYLMINGRVTNLYFVKGGENPGKIMLRTYLLGATEIGTVSATNKVNIHSQFLDKNSEEFKTNQKYGLLVSELKLIDKSTNINNKGKICKTNAQLDEMQKGAPL